MNLKHNDLLHFKNYINGNWVDASSNNTFDVFNPYDNSLIGSAPLCGTKETRDAISAAKTAFEPWKALTAEQRSELLMCWHALIEENKADLAQIMTLEQGKTTKEALGEINYGNSFIKFYAEEAIRIDGEVLPPPSNDRRLFVIKQPIGVCAAITPWNFPSAMILRKAGPALAAGCTIVFKPSEDTPLSAFALAHLANEAGIPAGVINIVTGDPVEIGKELSSNPTVKKLSFTGSTRVGKILMSQCSDTVKKLSLELGGNAPFIVFEDADVTAAVDGLITAKFRNSGQACISANRIYLHESIHDEFLAKLTPKVAALKVGNGFDCDTDINTLINKNAVEKIEHLVNDAVNKGAKALHGGKRSDKARHAFEPTILTNISDDADIKKTEIFGPIVAVYRFKNCDDIIKKANDTEYGLAAYFYTESNKRVWQVAEALEYGMVSINKGLFSAAHAPFGGIKESGFGREGSSHGIEDFLTLKYMCLGLE